MAKKIVWTKTATTQLQQVYITILDQSKSTEMAGRIVSDIHDATKILETQPEIYNLDEL